MNVISSNRILDLDDPNIVQDKLEVLINDSDQERQQKATQFLQLLLMQALSDKAIAINIFYDQDDDCLRALEYFAENSIQENIREFYPAPGYFAKNVLDKLNWLIGVEHIPSKGNLFYKYKSMERSYQTFTPDEVEIRIYFTDDRPTMKTK